MATYAIGDVQGCFTALQRLLEVIGFTPSRDRLWLVGDLVNRGPQSLEVLRFVRSLPPDSVEVVLGNHDLYLLMRAAGYPKRARDDTLDAVLAAPDRDELLDWLRARPLLVVDETLGYAMAHAGVSPVWSLAQAAARAREVEGELQGELGWLLRLKGDRPSRWRDDLSGMDRLRYIVNAFTRMRFVSLRQGALELEAKGPPERAPKGTVPWFRWPRRVPLGLQVVFGHWSALGFFAGDGVLGIDTGCVYGGLLTAVRLEDAAVFSVRGP